MLAALLEEVERIRLDAALKTVSTPVKASKLVGGGGLGCISMDGGAGHAHW